MADDPLLTSLLGAVETNPDDVPLRLHVAGVLLERGRAAEALAHCGAVLRRQPGNAQALALLGQAAAALEAPTPPAPPPESGATPPPPPGGADPVAGTAAGGPGEAPRLPHRDEADFDWHAAEREVADIPTPPLPAGDGGPGSPVVDSPRRVVRLADVAGMEQAKQRLELAFLGPMRHPELARAYGKNLRGGLLLYGPPGCGKTYLARATAGELGARFYSVSLADVLDQWLGAAERNVKELFDLARRNAPCVLFLDEIDAIGHRRSRIGSGWSGLRSTVNQLLTEMDSVHSDNNGVFVLAATNHPWDVDPALRRPGRLDRTILVLPPDAAAREAILTLNLRDRPTGAIDTAAIARRTNDYSGADLAHLVESAAELALAESMRSQTLRPITMAHLEAALREVTPSTGPWLQTARNVAQFGNTDGEYDDLVAYLRSRKLV